MKKVLPTLLKELLLFCLGGLVYVGIELLARGFSHWSMFIVGGLCFIAIGLINEHYEWDMPIQWQCLWGASIITWLELESGLIINKILQWNVWDYSDRPFNLFGQICIHHSICYWIPLSLVAIIVDDFVRWKIFHEEFPHYTLKRKK